MSEYTRGTPYMDQAPALQYHLDNLALRGADVVVDHVAVNGSPSFPTTLRGAVEVQGGTYVSFESINPNHAVMHMHAMGIPTKKVAESGKGFYYGLPATMTATEARRLGAGLVSKSSIN